MGTKYFKKGCIKDKMSIGISGVLSTLYIYSYFSFPFILSLEEVKIQEETIIPKPSWHPLSKLVHFHFLQGLRCPFSSFSGQVPHFHPPEPNESETLGVGPSHLYV